MRRARNPGQWDPGRSSKLDFRRYTGRPMSNSYPPAAKLFGRRIRIMYVAVLVLLFTARMWSVHGVHGFLETDAAHGKMAGIAGRLTGRSIEAPHAVFVRGYAPPTAAAHLLERSIADSLPATPARGPRLAHVLCARASLSATFSPLPDYP